MEITGISGNKSFLQLPSTYGYTVNSVYSDHIRDPKLVVVVDRWSLFGGRFMFYRLELRLRIVVALDRYSEVVVSTSLTFVLIGELRLSITSSSAFILV
jgi:hypothetical protein